MQQVGSFSLGARLSSLLALGFLLLFFAAPVQAQSGRKIQKRGEMAPVQPSAESAPVEKPAAPAPDKARIPVMIVRDMAGGVGSSFYTDIVMKGCADRLNDSASLSVSVGKEMNRKEASDAAKNSTDRYMLVLEMNVDQFNQSRSSDGVSVNFYLYTPGTGKSKVSGRVYPGDYRGGTNRGGVGLPLPVPNSAAGLEYMLRESGKEVADRVINALSLLPPPGRN